MIRRLLVLSVYPEDQAGTRLRAHQFAPHLLEAGVEVRYWSFFSLRDSQRWFSHPSAPARAALLLRSALRLLLLPRSVRACDAFLVLREALPIASSVVERLAARRGPLIWDVDDALWADYPRLFFRWVPRVLRRSSDKYIRICRLSAETWAGSEVLATWCRVHSSNVHVVPTVLDVGACPRATGAGRTVAWVGSTSTVQFLNGVLPALGQVRPAAAVVCVGAQAYASGQGDVRCEPWSELAESDALVSARVGVYPVDAEHPLAAGKAGFKAILYMAHGLPCVVSPTPTNSVLVRHDVEGLHASTDAEWRVAVQRLLDDDALWFRMSDAARLRAEREYSLQTWGPYVAGRVAQLTCAST